MTTLGALFDLIEREAHRAGQGNSASHRAMVEAIDAWLGSVIACPVDWRERVAAVPPGQGARYALALADAAAGKRIPRSVKPAPSAKRRIVHDLPAVTPAFTAAVNIDPFTGAPITEQEWIL